MGSRMEKGHFWSAAKKCLLSWMAKLWDTMDISGMDFFKAKESYFAKAI